MTAIVLRGDAAHLPLPDGSVDLIVTSPPYWSLRSYADGGEHYAGQIGAEETPWQYLAALLRCTAEWARVLKLSGSIFVNLGDKYGPGKSLLGLPWRYALGCVDDLGLILRAEIVWAKPNGLPESVTDRVRRSHEQVFHFTRQPRYCSAVDEIREPYDPGTAKRYALGYRRDAVSASGQSRNGVLRRDDGGAKDVNPLGKLPGSVWEIPSAPLIVPAWLNVEHFAAYPPELCRRIILGWSPQGAMVLDPFGGTGTTSLVADALGRIGISVDRSADYCRLARWRTTDPGERARALGVPKPPKQVDGQGDLFGTGILFDDPAA